jgi:predicted Zn-dependent peptidase
VDARLREASTARTGTAVALGLFLFAAPVVLEAEDPGRYLVLDNGLRVFLLEKRDLPLLHIVTGFDVGSKNETDATSGIVHLLEHCVLFRGTASRSGEEVGADIRRHGAYFNAHTGLDLSVFEISLPAGEAEFALRNQRDILFGFAVTQAELDGEKEVILEEFNQMEDDPRLNATDLVLQALFSGHPYGRSVYGRREAVRAAQVEDLLGFYRRYFVAGNCVLVVVGDFVTADMERMVREVFGSLPKSPPPAEPLPMAAPLKKSATQRLERDVEDGYLYLGFVAPDYNHADQYAMNVLTEVLGRGVNPLLPALLRGERDTVQTVDMAYLANRYGGAVVVSIRADPKDIPILERTAVNTLRRTQNESFSKKDFQGEAELYAFDYLESAKNQIRFAAGRADESGLQLAGSLVRYILLNTRENPGRYLDEIGKIDSVDLRKAAGKYLARGEWAMVSIVPKKEGR